MARLCMGARSWAQADEAARPRWRRATAMGAVVLAAGGAVETYQKGSSLQDLVDAMDTDEDGLVSMEEYMAFTQLMLDNHGVMDKTRRVQAFEFATRLFDRSDINGDEFLHDRELEYGDFISRMASKCQQRPGSCVDLSLGEATALEQLADFDTDGDGKVCLAEFRRGMPRRMAWWEMAQDLSFEAWEWLDNSFAKADVVKDGGLDWRELHFATLLANDIATWMLIQAVFLDADADKDGAITQEEADAPDHYVDDFGGLVRDLLREEFRGADEDADGMLSFPEVMRIASAVHRRLLGV